MSLVILFSLALTLYDGLFVFFSGIANSGTVFASLISYRFQGLRRLEVPLFFPDPNRAVLFEARRKTFRSLFTFPPLSFATPLMCGLLLALTELVS